MKDRFYLLRVTDPRGNPDRLVVPYPVGQDKLGLAKARELWSRLSRQGFGVSALEMRQAEEEDDGEGELVGTLPVSALGEPPAPEVVTGKALIVPRPVTAVTPMPGGDLVSFVNALDPAAIAARIGELDREREALTVLYAAALARRPRGTTRPVDDPDPERLPPALAPGSLGMPEIEPTRFRRRERVAEFHTKVGSDFCVKANGHAQDDSDLMDAGGDGDEGGDE